MAQTIDVAHSEITFTVRQIVVAHGGTIDVQSRDGLTTFTVRLPIGQM